MAAKLFIFGMPGCGKSEIARNIQTYVEQKRWFDTDRYWSAERFNDYPILDEMSKDKTEGKRFKRLEPKGFNVLDIEAFDIALQLLEQRITNYISPAKAKKEEIVLIEFARNDYWRAFRQFHKVFLQDAYFIYLGADLEVCKRRIRERTINPLYLEDDYPISDYIFEKYYHSDDRSALSSILQDVYGIDTERMLMLDNNGSLETALEQIEPFIDGIVKFSESHYAGSATSPESQNASRPVDQQEPALSK